MMRLGLIGVGRWGKNYARTIFPLPFIRLARITSIPLEIKPYLKPECVETPNWRDICRDRTLDGVIIATPAETHFEIASEALENGLNVLLEKPACLTEKDTLELYRLSQSKNKVCFVPYIQLYSPAFRSLCKSLIGCSPVQHIKTKGLSNGPFRAHTPVIWDWGVHEISIILKILRQDVKVIAHRVLEKSDTHLNGELIRLELESVGGIRAVCDFGNIFSSKVREIQVFTKDESFFIDNLNLLRESRREATPLHQIEVPDVKPLYLALLEFVDLVKYRKTNNDSLILSIKIARIIESASRVGCD